jgi:valacyclovir hydrolase
MPTFQQSRDSVLYYEIHGSGPPLLLLHGFMGTGSTEFPTLVPWLAERFQVILPDLRGYGRSTPKPRLYGVDFYRQDAEDMAALLTQLNLNDVAIMGYSDGGEIALWLPILASERVQRVITWGATGHFTRAIEANVLSMLDMRWRTPQIDALHGAEHMPEMTRRWVHSMLEIIKQGGDITYSRASEIRCPVLMILGDRDFLNPVAQGRAMAAAIPKGRFSVYPRTGHAVHLERPRWFKWQVGRFLRRRE